MAKYKLNMKVNYIHNSDHSDIIEVDDEDIEGMDMDQIRDYFNDELETFVWENVDVWIEPVDE